MRALKTDYRKAELPSADRRMLEFVEKLTLEPASTESTDLQELRRHGFDDEAISDIVQATALFAYYNRLAEGLGVDDEPEWQET